jgi:hypothetical protein
MPVLHVGGSGSGGPPPSPPPLLPPQAMSAVENPAGQSMRRFMAVPFRRSFNQ